MMERRTAYSFSVVAYSRKASKRHKGRIRSCNMLLLLLCCLYVSVPFFVLKKGAEIKKTQNILFEVSVNKTILQNVAVFWDTVPCSPYVNRRFERMHHLHFQRRESAEQETRCSRWLGWR
jgi:hypothetical protein